MKVLFLTNIPSPYRVDFFNELGKYCDLTVLYERKKADDREWLNKKSINYKSIFLNGIKKGNDTALCLGVIKYLSQKFDHIIIGGYSTPTGMLAILYLRFINKEYILNCDGGFIRKDEKNVNYELKKYFISRANCYLSTGKVCTDYLLYYGAEKNKIHFYPFTSLYEKDILERTLSVDEKELLKSELDIHDKKIVICVGQMIHRKGIDILLNAASNVSNDVIFYIVGGKPTEEYKKIINNLNLKNVRFLDFMQKNILFKYYQIADLFVLPTREDIWGLVINEAMANGLPIITTNKCVAGEELINQNGILIESEDVESLSNNINKILFDDLLQKEYANNSLQIIRNFTIENMASRIYQILLGGQ